MNPNKETVKLFKELLDKYGQAMASKRSVEALELRQSILAIFLNCESFLSSGDSELCEKCSELHYEESEVREPYVPPGDWEQGGKWDIYFNLK